MLGSASLTKSAFQTLGHNNSKTLPCSPWGHEVFLLMKFWGKLLEKRLSYGHNSCLSNDMTKDDSFLTYTSSIHDKITKSISIFKPPFEIYQNDT